MPKKTRTGSPGLMGMLDITNVLPTLAGRGSEKAVRTVLRLPTQSLEALDALAGVYKVSPRSLLAAAAGQLDNIRNNTEALKTLEELAGQVSFENATRRTQRLTKDSLRLVNDVAGKLGLAPDAIIAAMLGLMGADLEILTRRQRQKLHEALKLVDKLRTEAEDTEEQLIEILGAQHPISWEGLTDGVNKVHTELRHELHILRGTASPEKADGKPKPKKKKKAKKKSKAKTKAKAQPKPRPSAKPKPRGKTKTKTKTKMKRNPATRKK